MFGNLFIALIKYFGQQTEVDHGIWAHPFADWHYYVNGEEFRQRTLQLRFVHEKEYVWKFLNFRHSEVVNDDVAVVSSREGAGFNLDRLSEQIRQIGVNDGEAETCISLFDQWLTRKIPGFSWRGFTIATPG